MRPKDDHVWHRRRGRARAGPLLGADGLVGAMNALLAHRGPDGEGTWIHPHGRRASRIGASRSSTSRPAQQPMSDGAGNWVTYNGEIYNYVELRAAARRRLSSAPRSDTEVILAAYRTWGEDCVEHSAACSRSRSGTRTAQHAVLRARPLRHQAALLRGRRRCPLLRVRGEGAAAVSAATIETDWRASRTT